MNGYDPVLGEDSDRAGTIARLSRIIDLAGDGR